MTFTIRELYEMQRYLLYVFMAISRIARMAMIPMTMRATMAPEPEAGGEEKPAVISMTSFSVTASNLHVRFQRFFGCSVYFMCPVGFCSSSLATKSLAYKQCNNATTLAG